MRKLTIEPIFTADEADRVLAALEASQEHDLAREFRRTIEFARRVHDARIAAHKAEETRRAARAEHHVLTKRQAECLAAVRAGKGPFQRPWYWTDDSGVRQWRWEWARSMGGAVNRMVETLIEEGMLTERDKLSDAGRQRLAAWEAKNGQIAEGLTGG